MVLVTSGSRVKRHQEYSVSIRQAPAATARSGTQRARGRRLLQQVRQLFPDCELAAWHADKAHISRADGIPCFVMRICSNGQLEVVQDESECASLECDCRIDGRAEQGEGGANVLPTRVQLDSLGTWCTTGAVGQRRVALDNYRGVAFQREGERIVHRDLADFQPWVWQQPPVGKARPSHDLAARSWTSSSIALQASATHLPRSSYQMAPH